ncbi:MAG: hypothetical protein IPP78_00420 [Holophagaceae bacterium]|nr:hypothetical protein [Holophagaceae bacterium]
MRSSIPSKILLSMLTALPGAAQDRLPVFETRWTAESWQMPAAGERHMGMLGLQVNRRWDSGVYAGLGGWGSMTGERGGFITMGFDGGWRVPLTEHLGLDTGLWVGGGGAGRASVGGGLMLRGHSGLSWETQHGTYNLEWSRVRFPNGAIDSRQVALTAVFPFHMPAWNAHAAEALALPSLGHFREMSVLLTIQRYSPSQSVRALGGKPDRAPLDLGGLELRLSLGKHAFVVLDSAAAARGKADGYMDVFMGLGYSVDLKDSGGLRGVVKLAAGPAGGGNLDVGGGTAFKATVGLDAIIGKDGLLSVSGGYITAPSASFKARVVQIEAGRRFTFGTTSGPRTSSDWAWSWTGWAFRPSFLRMAKAQRRGNAEPLPIEFVGLHFSHDLGAGFETVGQGNFATSGKAGGFAQGLVGLAWRSPALFGAGPRLRLQGLIGASGGGGVDTSGGLVTQPSAGLEQDLSAGWSLQVQTGRSRAPNGKLDTSFLEGGLAWRFKVPTRL